IDLSRMEEFAEGLQGRIGPSSSAFESDIFRRCCFIPPSSDGLRIPISLIKREKGIKGTTIQGKMDCSTGLDKGSSCQGKTFRAPRLQPRGSSDQREQQSHSCGRCEKKQPGVCYMNLDICYRCELQGHRKKKFPYAMHGFVAPMQISVMRVMFLVTFERISPLEDMRIVRGGISRPNRVQTDYHTVDRQELKVLPNVTKVMSSSRDDDLKKRFSVLDKFHSFLKSMP
ncbi:hypothetical protein HAX54_052871, partial [Datura stramonium]|nr:hypothetical protein [Datura stramonium]